MLVASFDPTKTQLEKSYQYGPCFEMWLWQTQFRSKGLVKRF